MTRRLRGALNRTVRFFLSIFLWSNALFVLDLHGRVMQAVVRGTHLTIAEFALLALISLFSYLASTGFWPAVGNILYIYFFPFVLVFYGVKWAFKLLFVIGRFLKSEGQRPASSGESIRRSSSLMRLPGLQSLERIETIGETTGRWSLILRPFRRFTILWCLLVLMATHRVVASVALGVVLVHLARFVFRLIKAVFFSNTFSGTLQSGAQQVVDNWLAQLSVVSSETPRAKLAGLWHLFRNLEAAVSALNDEALVSRWAALICSVFLGCVYVYVAFLCSFVYYGMSHVAGFPDSWGYLFVDSLFIPFLITDLPKLLPLRLVAGLQITLVISIGVGTIFKYLTAQIRILKTVAVSADAPIRRNGQS